MSKTLPQQARPRGQQQHRLAMGRPPLPRREQPQPAREARDGLEIPARLGRVERMAVAITILISGPFWVLAYYLDEEDDSVLTEATPLATTSLRPLIQPKRHQPAAADQLSRSQPAADQLSRSQPAADQLSRSQPVADQLSRSQPVPAQLSQPLLPVQQWADSDPDFQQLGMA